MAVIFDTAAVAAVDRADRLRAILAETSLSSVALPKTGSPVHARLDVWPLGSTYLFRAETSTVRMFRTAQQATTEPVPLLALSVQERGAGFNQQFAVPSRVRPGTMMGVDMSEAFEFSWFGPGASRALMMPVELVNVPTDLLRFALPRLAQSPLYAVMTAHIIQLFKSADRLSAHPSAPDVANSSIDLARAVLMSLSTDGRSRREAAAQTLSIRIRQYVHQHVRDPDLNAESIARAQHISLRHLYNACSAAGISVEQYIIERRLRGVRAELSLPAGQRRSIESIAHEWGFRNISHFTRRFRAEFGVSPREWRAVSALVQQR